MKIIKFVLVINSLFILILSEIFAEVAEMEDNRHVACIGMSEEQATSYTQSPLSCW